MDSGGNSGSLQSSSGDEEYDSRGGGDSFSVFMNNSSLQQAAPPPQTFDPVSSYLQVQNTSTMNQNIFWSRSTDLGSEGYSSNISSSGFMANFNPPATVCGDSHDFVPPATVDSQSQNNNLAARNPKKRSRASRRAPTTVLTTDTSNFRAMVQEFTGIPAPPFTSSSPFQRNRIDLFGTSSSLRFPDPAQQSFLRRPFSQSVPPPPFLSSSASASTQSSPSSTSINYQLSPPNSNLFTDINTSSFLQSNQKFPFSRGFDQQFSATLHSLPNLESSDQIPARTDPENDNPTTDGSWRNNAASPDEINNQQLSSTRLFTGSSRINKLNNYSSSSSHFHEEKGQDNTPTRTEAMIEPWICSSE